MIQQRRVLCAINPIMRTAEQYHTMDHLSGFTRHALYLEQRPLGEGGGLDA